MAAVTFVYATWATRFPALAAQVAEPQAQEIFNEAQYVALGNDLVGVEGDVIPSLIRDPARRLALFNLLVAHMAVLELRNGLAGGAGAGMVGSVKSAGEGSVNIALGDYPVGTGKWYEQTQYGAQFWQMLASFRTARYVPGPRSYTGVPRVAGR